MAELDVIEGTGAELEAHLRRFPARRFKLIPVPGLEHACGSETNGAAEAEQNVASAAAAIEALRGRGARRRPNPDGWRTTIGMFKDSPVIDDIDAASIRLREADFEHE